MPTQPLDKQVYSKKKEERHVRLVRLAGERLRVFLPYHGFTGVLSTLLDAICCNLSLLNVCESYAIPDEKREEGGAKIDDARRKILRVNQDCRL